MITRYEFLLSSGSGTPLPPAAAYRLYAWLLQQLPQELGDAWHLPGKSPVAQYLACDAARENNIWILHLLDDCAAGALAPVLEHLQTVQLHENTLHAALSKPPCRVSARELTEQAQQLPDVRRRQIGFVTPTAFKQDGQYVIFPQERLLLQSLILRWNEIFPELSLQDEDAFLALVRGLSIRDYRLTTARYPLKNVRIPGFYGTVWIESRLPAPLEEVWRQLICFLPYVGVGIKTTLGMGGAVCP